MKKPALMILIATAALLGGCAQYSLDMSGLDRYTNDTIDETADYYSMTTLDGLSSDTMGRVANDYTMRHLDEANEEALSETAKKYGILRLDEASDTIIRPASDGLTMSDAERAASDAFDPRTVHR